MKTFTVLGFVGVDFDGHRDHYGHRHRGYHDDCGYYGCGHAYRHRSHYRRHRRHHHHGGHDCW